MKIIAYSIDRETGIYTSDGRHQDESPYLEFILQDTAPETIQCFSNLDFDVAGLLALLKPSPKELETLAESESLSLPPYRFKYFPGKFFGLDKGFGAGHPFANISDIEQYDNSFDKIENRHDEEYWFGRAKAAHLKALEVYDIFVQLGLSPTNLISPKNVYDTKLTELNLPTILDIPEEVTEIAFDGCYGNFVEAYQQGHFLQATDLDITSAYPHWASRLLDLRQGKFNHSKDYEEKAFYGYARCEVMIDAPFSPIMWKSPTGDNYTPKGIFERNLTKNQIDFINKFEIGYATVIDGYWFYPKKIVRPLLKPIQDLYELKQASQGLKREIIKRVLTGSFYGALIQTNKGEPAKHCCPPWANEIEANCQLQVASFVMKNHLVEKLLAVVVDGVLISGDFDLPEGNGMGTWRKSYTGEAIVVNSALRCIKDKVGEGDFSLTLDELKDMLTRNPTLNEWHKQKLTVLSLGQAMNEKRITEVGRITTIEMTIGLQDNKRVYLKQPKNGRDLLTHQFLSEPWSINILKTLTARDEDFEKEEDEYAD